MFKYQEFSESSLSRCFVSNDFFSDNRLSESEYRADLLKKSVHDAENMFPSGLQLGSLQKNNKKTYFSCDLPQRIVLRKCAKNIRAATSIKLKSRTQIARELQVYLAEGTPYRVYRLDIRSFFESIDYKTLFTMVNELSNLSMHTKNIILAVTAFFNENVGCSVPRGIETSPLLSELILSDFDNSISSCKEVIYYSRFVDDLIIITSAHEDELYFINKVELSLPGNLKFNKEKTEIVSCKKRDKAGSLTDGKLVVFFDYLGLSFKVYDSPLPSKKIQGGMLEENAYLSSKTYREVHVDLSEKKVKKIKSRICKAFYTFHKDKNYLLLRDRIRFLTTNRSMINKNKDTVIPVGIYYNNSPVNFPSKAIEEIDCFLTKMTTSKNGRLCKFYSHLLTKKQKKELLQYNFTRGFSSRLHKRFSANRLVDIVRIWK
uniref:antiviral reverse transcriptase Drt3a n=1 Tax=Marinobacterium profundum TaxID=1714300 RepID=UPI000A7BA738|nr:antiviral reverse transcriptase Drt3a [Marinobacterium profundum]